jgi:integrase
MARWDDSRQAWRITAETTRPGAKRSRAVRLVHQPNTDAGRRRAEIEEMRLRVEAADTLAADPGTFDLGTFGEAAMAWFERGSRWSPNTRRTVGHALRHVILDDRPDAGGPRLGDLPLEKVTAKRIEAMYGRWDRINPATGKPRYADSAARRYHAIVRKILADAERLDETETYRSPMTRVEAAGGAAKPRTDLPKPAEVRAVIAGTSEEMAVFFEIAAQYAARRGSIEALRWRDVDTERGLITFEHAIAQDPDGRKIRKGTKADTPVVLPLVGRALAGLKAHRGRALETALELGLAARFDSLYVFTSARLSQQWGLDPWSIGAPSHAWRKAADKVGLEHVRLHDVRHLAASQMLARGISVKVVARLMGCTEANVQRTYSHWVDLGEIETAAGVLAEVFA